jgi:hypothetical protein
MGNEMKYSIESKHKNLSMMKKILVSCISLTALLLLSNIVWAQKKTSSTPEERAGKMTEWMKTNLQLNDDQATQVQAINLKYANKTQELQSQTISRKQKMQVLKDNDKKKDAELKNVLTADQYNSYQAKKDEIRKQMKERMRDKKTHGKMT